VILLDANLLLYAKFADFPQHFRARQWLEEQFNSRVRIGIPWQTSLAFLRIATNPRILGRPLSIRAAWQQVLEWLEHQQTWIPAPTDAHAEILGEILARAQVTANLIPDAHLAALAVEHGLTICSADGDFARFPAVEWHNPIAE
jgi:uncharacterized protein